MKNSPPLGLSLQAALERLASLQHQAVDRLALQAAVTDSEHGDPAAALDRVCARLQLPPARWLAQADPAALPALVHAAPGQRCGRWGVALGLTAQGAWVTQWWDAASAQWRERQDASLADCQLAQLSLARPPHRANHAIGQLVRQELARHGHLLRDAVLGGILINVVALASSLYSMQVYDRVVPSGAMQTLLVLTLGALGAILFELLAKRLRSRLYEGLVDAIDQTLARATFERFLAIRMERLPRGVGALAAQLRGYEAVRSFFTSIVTSVLVDAPFALLFAALIVLIGGALALIPLLFLLLSLGLAWHYHGRVRRDAAQAVAANNLKQGLLVEAVEGAETIKSGQGGWRLLARWMATTDQARASEMATRAISESCQHLAGAFQQCAYVLLVAIGAVLITKGELSMGALVACSILSGRVLAPIAMIPQYAMQWAHTRAALAGLEALWSLPVEAADGASLALQRLEGAYRLDAVVAGYEDHPALQIADLHIAAGEKIGILGPVGAGKTTLLRLLSGMYAPQQGRVLLDGADMRQLAKPLLADTIAYVAQDGRLFSGTLRENLILGQIDPGDDAIRDAAQRSGLWQTVVQRHPQGLQQPIHEGGTGLSGGQRQLVNITRALLRAPSVWLLDEPTASMDRQLEIGLSNTLSKAIGPADTLLLVTHKQDMLVLVDRLIVIANQRIVLDGPKREVLQRLQQGGQP